MRTVSAYRRLSSLHQPQLRFLRRDLRRLFDNIELLDAQPTLGDLVGRKPELFEIAARLAEMALKVEHPLLEPPDILFQAGNRHA